jgi:hypothetical protein
MATSIDANGNTNGVSGKVIAGTAAGGLATAVGSSLVYELSKVHVVAQIFADMPWLPGVLVGAIAALCTFAAGYIAKHAPAGLVEDFRQYVPTTANPANEAPANAGSINPPDAAGPPTAQ